MTSVGNTIKDFTDVGRPYSLMVWRLDFENLSVTYYINCFVFYN